MAHSALKFKDEFPNYLASDDSVYYTKSMPDGLVSALIGVFYRYIEDAAMLRGAVDDLLTQIPAEPTGNWSFNYLQEDFSDALRKLSKKFPRFMDGLRKITDEIARSTSVSLVDDLNELFDEMDFGYSFESFHGHFYWVARDTTPTATETLDKTAAEVEDICSQALSHIRQAAVNLRGSSERARKDAVRDSLSAMESLLKKISGAGSVKDATSALRSDDKWGPDLIVKDGLSIWDRIHALHPDIRHGNPKASKLSPEEASYWVERINVFILYITRVYGRRA